MVLLLDANDYNGECFVVGSEGEREESLLHRIVWFPATDPISDLKAADMSKTETRTYVEQFIFVNYEALIAAAVDPTVARKVAFLRFLAHRNGLFKVGDTAAQHNCRYAEMASGDTTINDIKDWDKDAVWRSAVRPKLMDMVCMMAYFFRVRGHHWTQEMDERYKDVWRKCLYDEDTPGLDWQFVAHHAFHAIFPDDLDTIWINSARNGMCAGALIKRIDSAPAGVAGIAALNAGVSDLRLVVPRAFDYMKDSIVHLEDVTARVTGPANRWNGSVNRRFYAAATVKVDEANLGKLAALIMATLDQFALNSPLRRSQALARIAANCPITGSLVARMVKTAVQSDAAAETFLPEAPKTTFPGP